MKGFHGLFTRWVALILAELTLFCTLPAKAQDSSVPQPRSVFKRDEAMKKIENGAPLIEYQGAKPYGFYDAVGDTFMKPNTVYALAGAAVVTTFYYVRTYDRTNDPLRRAMLELAAGDPAMTEILANPRLGRQQIAQQIRSAFRERGWRRGSHITREGLMEILDGIEHLPNGKPKVFEGLMMGNRARIADHLAESLKDSYFFTRGGIDRALGAMDSSELFRGNCLDFKREEKIRKLLELAPHSSKARFKKIMDRIPPGEAADELNKALKSMKYAAEDSPEFLATANRIFEELRELDVQRYNLLRGIGGQLEVDLGLSPGMFQQQEKVYAQAIEKLGARLESDLNLPSGSVSQHFKNKGGLVGFAELETAQGLEAGALKRHIETKYGGLKKMAGQIEVAEKLKKGTIARHLKSPPLRLRHPDEAISRGYEIATADPVYNARAMQSEFERFAEAVTLEARAGGYYADTLTMVDNAPRFVEALGKWIRRPWNLLHLFNHKLSIYISRVVYKALKTAAFGFLAFGVVIGALVMYQWSAEAERLKKENEKVDEVRRQLERRLVEEQIPLLEEALLLTIEVCWETVRIRFRNKGDDILKESPFETGDDMSADWLRQVLQQVLFHFSHEGQSIFEKKTQMTAEELEKENEARKLVEETAKALKTKAPVIDKELNQKFYRALWVALLVKAKEMGALPASMPEARKPNQERDANRPRPRLTIDELANEMAVSSPAALLRARNVFKADEAFAKALQDAIEEKDEDFKEFLNKAREIDPKIAEFISNKAVRRQTIKKEGEDPLKDPLPLPDPDPMANPMPDPNAPAVPPASSAAGGPDPKGAPMPVTAPPPAPGPMPPAPTTNAPAPKAAPPAAPAVKKAS